MSYDISLTINTGKEDVTVVNIGNYTWNIRPLCDKAFGVDDWKFIRGMKCKDAAPLVDKAYDYMQINEREYMLSNHRTTSGNFSDAKELLANLYTACEAHPEATVSIH